MDADRRAISTIRWGWLRHLPYRLAGHPFQSGCVFLCEEASSSKPHVDKLAPEPWSQGAGIFEGMRPKRLICQGWITFMLCA